MRRASVGLLLALVACGRAEGDVMVSPSLMSFIPKPDPVVKGVEHGTEIVALALTEQSDAALTIDRNGGARLWPALNPSRTPVPLFVHAADRVAISHAGRELLAVIQDNAGSVSLLRVRRDGTVRAHAQLPGDVHFEQIVAIEDGVLARTADHAIGWYTADGDQRGRIVVEPGWRVQSIAARRGAAVALVTDGKTTEMRWLDLRETLAWGAAYKLPKAFAGEAMIALSPSHRRIAIVEADPGPATTIYELGLLPKSLAKATGNGIVTALGFATDDRLAIVGGTTQWLEVPRKVNDPWATSIAPPQVSSGVSQGVGSVGDGLLVTAFGTSLALSDDHQTRYLGFKAQTTGVPWPAGELTGVSLSNSRHLWLDDKLQLVRDVDFSDRDHPGWMFTSALDARYVLRERQNEGLYELDVLDAQHWPTQSEPVLSLGKFKRIDKFDFSPTTGLIAVSTGTEIDRFRLDLSARRVTRLDPLPIKTPAIMLRALDPAQAGGIVAVVLGYGSDYDASYSLSIYRQRGKQLARTKIKPFAGTVIRIDPDGTIYSAERGALVIRHGETKVSELWPTLGSRTWLLTEISSLAREGTIPAKTAIDGKGTRFAMSLGNELVLFDVHGEAIWHKPLWGAQHITFTSSDKYIIVSVQGGFVAYDAATGERAAMECGWEFDLTTTPPQQAMLGTTPVCEDPSRP